MKQTTRNCSKRFLPMLMAIALLFFNVEVASAVEITESEISAETNNSSESTDFVNNVTAHVERLDSFVVPDVPAPTSYTEVYERIIAWKDIIPTGTPYVDYFGNHTMYTLNVPINVDYFGNHTIETINVPITRTPELSLPNEAAFALILNDAAFGKSPARGFGRGFFREEDIKFESVRVGDILCINDNGRINYVIVLQINSDGVIVAKVDNNGIVNWESSLSVEDVRRSRSMITRYPDDDSNNLGSVDNPETGIGTNRDLLVTVMITALAILAIAGVPWLKLFKRKLRIKS